MTWWREGWGGAGRGREGRRLPCRASGRRIAGGWQAALKPAAGIINTIRSQQSEKATGRFPLVPSAAHPPPDGRLTQRRRTAHAMHTSKGCSSNKVMPCTQTRVAAKQRHQPQRAWPSTRHLRPPPIPTCASVLMSAPCTPALVSVPSGAFSSLTATGMLVPSPLCSTPRRTMPDAPVVGEGRGRQHTASTVMVVDVGRRGMESDR